MKFIFVKTQHWSGKLDWCYQAVAKTPTRKCQRRFNRTRFFEVSKNPDIFFKERRIYYVFDFFLNFKIIQKWYFVTKIVLTNCEKNCSSDREKLLKFEAEGPEFAKILRSLEQFIYSNSERSEQFLLTECFFNLFLEVSHI